MTTVEDRLDPPNVADERAQLTGFMDFQRGTIVWKSSGLTDEQARRSLMPSELITVSGLLAHLTLNEEWWFEVIIGGKPNSWEEMLDEDPDAEFRMGMRTELSTLIDQYKAQCEASRKIVAERGLDDVITAPNGKQFTVRWVVLHMIEETARHAGHLDLIREQLDGLTGE